MDTQLPDDAVVVGVATAVLAISHNDLTAARAALIGIDLASLVTQRKRAMDMVWGPGRQRTVPERVKVARRNPSGPDKSDTFKRDQFTCRYCGRFTVWLPILQGISRALTDVMPYHPNWRPLEPHILYWTYSTSLEHHIPLARGGSNTSENFVTTCYQCNDVKNYYLAEELGWRLLPPSGRAWDGLASLLPGLPAAVRESPPLSRAKATPRTRETLSPIVDIGGLVEGSLIRARLPGKLSRRSYRVTRAVDGSAVLTEIWRSGVTGVWTASATARTVLIADLEGVELIAQHAPEIGSS